MSEIIGKDTRKLTDAGDSKRVSINKSWLQILGFDEVDEVETAIVRGKYGLFFGAWIEGEQPEIEDLEEKVDILESE